MDDSELVSILHDAIHQIELQLMALRHKIERHTAEKSKDEVEQAFDECEKSDDEAACPGLSEDCHGIP